MPDGLHGAAGESPLEIRFMSQSAAAADGVGCRQTVSGYDRLKRSSLEEKSNAEGPV